MSVRWKIVISPTKRRHSALLVSLIHNWLIRVEQPSLILRRAGGRLPQQNGWLQTIMRRLKSNLDPQTLEDVFDFLCQYNRQFGYSPTLREVSEACYMSRPNMY